MSAPQALNRNRSISGAIFGAILVHDHLPHAPIPDATAFTTFWWIAVGCGAVAALAAAVYWRSVERGPGSRRAPRPSASPSRDTPHRVRATPPGHGRACWGVVLRPMPAWKRMDSRN
jgi:hypothetical protein